MTNYSKEPSSLFSGVVNEYVKYRPRYPKDFIDQVLNWFQADGQGRLLDAGCGPGTVTLDMSIALKRSLASIECRDD
ncbi:hypothetical protein [Thermoactinomyces sp. CICC 10521]|uniref:hypothetical protein n=1 Tax=Thermoactinomyces sp. CICC 10521 TaxID=2767426 RepID=UPI0018DC2207|nr:hypothetical protein [Thermoactinomyces sp. CICC 10521]MBH8608022.1 hypothetical protein [Thermoactinomyces sp. CICC 10521]